MNPSATPAATMRYRLIWRWHFYAGLFCIPFILWLATTGALYLFKPQVEAWLDRGVDHLVIDGPRASAQAQVEAAVAAVPGSTFFLYELPPSPQSAVRVIVRRGDEHVRVYVDPVRLAVLEQVDDESRLMNVISRLHGELLLGNPGSWIVELAASWAIVMIVTGLYLWWPRNNAGLGGVLYPRLYLRGRVFWRDLHGVVGLWVSAFALFLLVSGLPWTSFWGSNLEALRRIGAPAPAQQDWTTDKTQNPLDVHAGHHAADGGAADDLAAIDRIVATVAPLHLAPPVLIGRSEEGADWTARSDAQNRPRRTTLTLDPVSGTVLHREDFVDRKLTDRIVGYGIAAHEGQLFGWANQLLGLVTALALMTLSASALVLWWRRRTPSTLGAPASAPGARAGAVVLGLIVALCVLLPMLGISLLLTLLVERLVLRRVPAARAFLGLEG